MKKHRKEKLVASMVLAVLGLAGTASGFPTWMGVYGSYQTHDGANPGTYTILMNQDYWGLHAEVGIGIAGTWTTHAMEYAGNADGNSLWRFRPGEAVAEGATVQYYFHGWDDWGGNLYANNGGTNYSFVAGPAEIDWIGDSEQTPAAPVAGEDIRFWTQTWPRGAGQSGFALFSAGGAWSGIPLAKAGVTNGNDLWRGTLGRLPAGTAVEWVAAVEDGAGTTHYDNNWGSNYAFTVAAGSPLAFFGNAYHWPADGALTSADDLWLNVFASPSQTLVEAHSDYAVNGWVWERTPLSFRQLDGTNEWWHADLGTMPPASTVFYAFDALDGAGNALAFPASGIPQVAHVAGSPADADADGLPDDWEAYWFADPSATTAHANPDGDGLPGMPFDNWMERVAGTDPTVSNEVAELPLLWKPSLPQQGGVVLLSAAPEALAGLTLPAITATFADGTTATLALDESGRWSGTAWIARTNAACTIVSFSGGGETDGNRGLGWTLPVQVLPEGEKADSDGDGMPDSWEAANALDPLADDASGDPDSDGISNLDEYLAGLDPQAPEADLWWDFDGDGVPTLVERQRHTDPADPDDVPEADLLLSPDPADWAARIAAAVATNPAPYTIVQLAGGTYATNSGIVLSLASSNLVLVGSADPANPTVLDGQLLGRCVSVTGDNVSLSRLRLANGVGYTYYPGGAIYAGGVRNLLLSHCRIENCFSDAQHAPSAVPTRSIPVPWGAALYMGGVGGSAAFANTLVCGCGEGALFAAPEGSAALRLANCTLVDNDTGPAFTGFSPLSVENGIIWHCGDVADNLPADTAIANICLESEPSCTNTTGVTTNPPGLVHGWRVDGTESSNVLAYAASPLACDIEGDLRPALSALGADEWRDRDGDGIPDWWEVLHGFDPEDPGDAESDPDGDGLDNASEYGNETPPRVADADGDGWTDGEEVAAGTDPLDRLDAPRLAKGVLLHAVKYAADGSNQWVQLHCSGPRAVDVGGFRLQAAGTNWVPQVVLPEGTWMTPGHFLLVGGEGVTNADVTAEWALAGTYSNLPTAGVRLMPPEGSTNGPVDVVMYAQNLCFNENGLDTTGWLSQTTNLWSSSTRHLERWNLGDDTDRENDWRHALDGEEPANSAIALDTDGDGLTDEEEYMLGCDPFDPDSDGDGLLDGFEAAHGLDPTNGDTDGDGTPDGEEHDGNGGLYFWAQFADGVAVTAVTPSKAGWQRGESIGSNGTVRFEFANLDGVALWATFEDGGHQREPFTLSATNATIRYESELELVEWPLWRKTALIVPDDGAETFSVTVADDRNGNPVTNEVYMGVDLEPWFDVVKLDLTAYRPQTEGPGYGHPFQRHAVPEAQEEEPGAGIRINGDWEGTSSENDRLEVEVNVSKLSVATNFTYALQFSTGNVVLWNSMQTTSLVVPGTQPVAFVPEQPTTSFWADNPSGGTDDLTLSVAMNGVVFATDTVHFYPFTGIVIALGGETQSPTDPAAADHGVFRLAGELYCSGYDVHMYDEDNVSMTGAGAVYDEIMRAIQHRGVSQVAIYGYSHGGGSTYDLAKRLDDNRNGIGTFSISFSAYIDAVSQSGGAQENRRPPGSIYHVNYYQEGVFAGWPLSFFDGGLDGGPIEPPGADFEVNVDANGQAYTHFTIDDDNTVLQEIRTRLEARMNR